MSPIVHRLGCFFFTLLIFTTLLSTTARADEPGPTEAKAEASSADTIGDRHEIAVSFHPGTFSDGHGTGALLGADVTYRYGVLAIGVLGDRATMLMTPYASWTGAGSAGISAPLPDWVRLDLVGVAGVHAYSGVGASPFLIAQMSGRGGEGASATLPFLGSRLRLGTKIGKGAAAAIIGIEGFAEADTERVTRAERVTTISAGSREDRPLTVGTERVGAALTLGGVFAL